VFDPFGSSAATLIAAEKSGRVACLMELDPRCVDDCASLAGLDRQDCDSGLR
jgi:DNA modification methylase